MFIGGLSSFQLLVSLHYVLSIEVGFSQVALCSFIRIECLTSSNLETAAILCLIERRLLPTLAVGQCDIIEVVSLVSVTS